MYSITSTPAADTYNIQGPENWLNEQYCTKKQSLSTKKRDKDIVLLCMIILTYKFGVRQKQSWLELGLKPINTEQLPWKKYE